MCGDFDAFGEYYFGDYYLEPLEFDFDAYFIAKTKDQTRKGWFIPKTIPLPKIDLKTNIKNTLRVSLPRNL